MQLLLENQTILVNIKDLSMSANISMRDTSSDKMEEQRSHASLLLMNPVASGDNVATGMNSTHKLKEDLPSLVPCCEGKELQINEDLVHIGLSAISVKHDNVIQCLSLPRACERLQVPPGHVKHRNSFRCLHRPDLKRVPYLRRMTPDELETLFLGYADLPTRKLANTENRDDVQLPKSLLPPNEDGQPKGIKIKEIHDREDGIDSNLLNPKPETQSGVEDVPTGMRLHGARARLYTSVLDGVKAGDQLDAISTNEEFDIRLSEDPLPEDEIQLNEELQIILPPRCDDITTASSITTTSTE